MRPQSMQQHPMSGLVWTTFWIRYLCALPTKSVLATILNEISILSNEKSPTKRRCVSTPALAITKKMAMSSTRRSHTVHPDSFCYICGNYTIQANRRHLTDHVKKLYAAYFDPCKVSDQDKKVRGLLTLHATTALLDSLLGSKKVTQCLLPYPCSGVNQEVMTSVISAETGPHDWSLCWAQKCNQFTISKIWRHYTTTTSY